MSTTTIPVGQLLLDTENPRHPRVASQNEAILALIEEQGPRLVKLAEDLATNGASPTEVMVVMKRRGTSNYTVLEGNRRLAAVRLLNNPAIAKGTKFEQDFARLAKGDKAALPTEFECWIAHSREEARPWIRLRHTGTASGVGLVPWAPRQIQRFELNPETHAGKASMFIDSVEKAYPKNQSLLDNLQKISDERLTTLGRLLAEPEFRKRLGLKEVEREYHSHFPAEVIEDVIDRVATDLASTLTVTNIKTKAQRLQYLDKLPTPDPDARRDDAQPLVPGTAAATTKKPTRKVVTRPKAIFSDFAPKKLGARLPLIVQEVRTLDPQRHPNAVSVLLRVVLELALAHVYERKKLTGDNLAARVKRCLRMIDSTGKADAYEPIRVGLADPNSIFSVSTLHAYVHNKYFHPEPAQVRAVAANMVPFLEGLDALA